MGTTVTKRHGETANYSTTKEYEAWKHIKGRCSNPNVENYKYYGGRGVTVHPEWASSFEEFLRGVGRAPTPEHSIDRWPNTNGNYEPGNVRWATMYEQTRNKTCNTWIEFGGKCQILTDWAREIGISPGCLRLRFKRGMSIEQALTSPGNCSVCLNPLPANNPLNRKAHRECRSAREKKVRRDHYHSNKVLLTPDQRSALCVETWKIRRGKS